MLFSIYPTDAPELRAQVVDQVLTQSERLVFTSFHIPESEGIQQFGDYLGGLHREHGLTFCGDISPLTLERLGMGVEEVSRLREWGVALLRIDFGFTVEEIRRIAEHFPIAVNASTIDAGTLDALTGVEVIGWHNYYPRPETGLQIDFYLSQNQLLADRGIPVYGFIPGEVTFRAPLFAGLPMLEHQRHRNVYRNALELLLQSPDVTLVCAEGTLLPEHLSWLDHVQRTGEVVVPLSGLDASVGFLVDGSWRLRVEDSAASFRVEETRQARSPARIVNADARVRGSLQMDLSGYGRYCGEIHLMRTDRPLNHLQARVGEVAAAYRGIIDLLRPGMQVRFVPDPAR